MPLNILIVGGGIGGLSAAVGFRKAGHHVKVLEASSMASEVGAAITVPPNATRILRAWGVDLEQARMVTYKEMQVIQADVDPMREIKVYNQGGVEDKFHSPYVLSHRVDLHQALRLLALDKPNPAEIITKAHVTDYDTSGAVTLADGSKVFADLIVAADGVHSRAHISILGYEKPAIPSNTTVVRFMLPTKVIQDDPKTTSLLAGGDGQVSIYTAGDGHRWLVRYPCRNNELQNFGAYATNDNDIADEWTIKSNRASLLRRLEGFHPSIIEICHKTTEILPLWKCTDRDPLPRLHLDKLVLLGDALHPMLPNCGQGAAQAIEDAAVLGVLFHDAKHSDISQRLQLYEVVRKERTAASQLLSTLPVGVDSVEQVTSKHPEYFEHGKIPKTKLDVMSFFFGYDCVKEVSALLRLTNQQCLN